MLIIESLEDTEDVYDITVEDNHSFYANGVVVHNCAEQQLPNYGVCNLASVNLSRFVKDPFTASAQIGWDQLAKTIHIGIRFSDNVIDTMEYPLPQIEHLQKNTRRIGLGITGLADMFIMLGVDYGSDQSIKIANEVAECLQLESIKASVVLAKEKGKFKRFNADKYFQTPLIKDTILDTDLRKKIRKYGMRNIALNTVAPVGTGSIALGENCSSGIEPVFAPRYTRTIRTGNGEETRQEDVIDYAFFLAEKLGYSIPSTKTVQTLDPMKAMEIQKAFQSRLDSSISKTYNLPSLYTIEEYKELILAAANSGLVGFTSYNPNGSLKGILVEKREKKVEEADREAPKRPKSLPCDIHTVSVKGRKYILLVGHLEGQPYEVFTSEYKDDYDFVKEYQEGTIVKVKKGHYQLIVTNGEDKKVIDNITQSFNPDYEAMSRLLSITLRHGTPIEFVVEQLGKTGHFGTWGKMVSIVLKRYVKDGLVKTSQKCENCGSTSLIYLEGCLTCQSCGSSHCG